jgi:gliding motility-associated lipoprotein GldH
MNRVLLTGIAFILIQACQSDITYTQYQPIDNAAWKQENSIKFKIPIKDTINQYNLFINIRNTKDYPYSNLYLITQMTFPNKVKIIDTLEYEMTDPRGRFLGDGFSDIKENKLFYKENVRFQEAGNYLFEVRQAMRKRNEVQGINPLPGISDVGFSIEKQNN